jgi:uncharacterized protein YlxP (DUF503 family)
MCESMDSKFDYEVVTSDKRHEYKFSVGNTEVSVNFDNVDEQTGIDGSWHLSWATRIDGGEWTDAATGESGHGAIKLISGVYGAVNKFIESNVDNISQIYFGARHIDGSRKDVYQRLVDRLSKKYNISKSKTRDIEQNLWVITFEDEGVKIINNDRELSEWVCDQADLDYSIILADVGSKSLYFELEFDGDVADIINSKLSDDVVVKYGGREAVFDEAEFYDDENLTTVLFRDL